MEDEIKRLSINPENTAFDEELRRIREEKIKEIRHTIRGLIATQNAEVKYDGGKNFSSFLWENIFPETTLFNIDVEKFLSNPETEIILNSMASFQYIPPPQFREAIIHLYVLFVYYTKISKERLTLSEFAFDYSFAKLMFIAGMFYEHSLYKGSREIRRTIKTNKTRQEQSANIKAFIIAIYEHGKKIEKGTKFNKACDFIQTQFEYCRGIKCCWGTIPKDPRKMPTPSIDSIERCLKEDGIHKRDFRRKGRFWIKQT